MLSEVLQALPLYGYRMSSELALQDGIEEVLKLHDIPFEREAVRGADRFDFLCAGGVAIEAKVFGSYSQALRQAERYCRQDDVTAVVICSTRRWCTTGLPQIFHGRPVHTMLLGGQHL